MGSKFWNTLLLIAGLLLVVSSQQYEVEPSRVWHPSRTQRTQNPSLFGSAQSSPRVPQSAVRNPLPEFEQPRQRQVTRNRAASRASQPTIIPQEPTTLGVQRTSSQEAPVDERNFRKNQQINYARRGAAETRGRSQNRAGSRTSTTAEPQRVTEYVRSSSVRRAESRKPEIPAGPKFPTASEELANFENAPTRVPFKTSSEQISLESSERHGPRKPQRNSFRSSENGSKSTERSSSQRFASRSGPSSVESMRKQFRPDPTKVASRERTVSREQFGSSREDTPPVPTTTEGYTEPLVTTSKQTRGRSRAPTPKPISSGQRPTFRGDKKSDVVISTKQIGDDISEEDNYPKEFIEKIKSSAEVRPSFSPKPSNSPKPSSRLARNRVYQPSRANPQPRPSSTDSDVSESIHEETIEQELPFVTKPKEAPSLSKGRYFGRPKYTTTTTTTTTITTPSTRPAPSHVDALRQRYRDKLKLSQEERQQKLSNLRPKLQIATKPDIETPEKKPSTVRSFTKEPFKPVSRYSRTQKNRYDPKMHPPSAAAEPQSPVRFRPRFSLTGPDSSIEPATPTVAEHARARNRYARLRKEELSVETPEVKTSWAKDEGKPKPNDATYNFIRLRTKDLTPLASEDVMESIINNELFDTPTTVSSSSAEPPTTTSRAEETTEPPMTTVTRSEATTTMASGETMDSSINEVTTVAAKEATTVQVTIAPVQAVTEVEDKSETVVMNLASASTRFRFSSKYSTENTPESSSTEMTTENDAPASTLSFSTFSPVTSSSTTVTTTLSTTTTTKQSTTAKKGKPAKTTTPIPSFLQNRPVLRNLVSLFSPTTTKKPATRKAKPKTPKPTTKKMPSTTTTVKPIAENTISPLPLASAEEIINSTQAVIKNHTSTGNPFGKVPRDELDALTPLTFINTTEASTTAADLADRINIPNTTDEIKNVTSQSMYFDYSSTEKTTTTTTTTTTPTTTTADYFVYGIYPNNTVVRKRAWKTFDYEKYMTPYVIFGIYPNNTIVRKFPNGTIINDEFMTSDNEIGDPSTSSSTSTSTTTTTEASNVDTSSELSTFAPTTESPEEGTEPTVTESEIETTEMPAEEVTESPYDEVTENPYEEITEEITTEGAEEEITESPQVEAPAEGTTETPQVETTDVSMDTTTENRTEDAMNKNVFDPYLLDRLAATTESMLSTPDDVQTIPPSFWRIGLASLKETTSTMRSETPSTMKTNEETTIDPTLNQVLPLTLEEVQSLWSGNFSDSVTNDSVVSSSINLAKSANLLSSPDKELVSLKNIAFRALSTAGTTTTMRPTESTTEEMTSTQEPTTRKPRVKFVTVTPSVLVMSDLQTDDAITQSSEHVQRVTKASTQIPNDLLTSVFGQLQEKASSPIPDILKDVGSEVEGDGLTAALARRIIALAMERAKSTTTDTPVTSTTEMSTTMNPTTVTAPKTTKRVKSTRTTSKGQSSSPNALSSLSTEKELNDVLQQLLVAQNLEQSLIAGTTTVKAPADLEKTVENQIRLAEEVRKASRTMKKKKKKNRTTTTPAPPPFLGFLFNFFNRPPTSNPTPIPNSGRTAKKVQGTPSPSPDPDGQVFVLTSLPSDVDATSTTDTEVQGERQTRGQLLTAAIDVTRAVSKFMGTVISNAAQSFQSFMRNNNWGR